MISTATDLDARHARLREILAGTESALIAYSGGVDSTLLLKVARDVLGDRAAGAIAVSPSLPARELDEARAFSAAIGVRLIEVRTDEVANPEYAKNPANRCFFCKSELFAKLLPLADREGFRTVIYGEIADDAGDFRPGRQAAREARVRAPLQEAGFTKSDVRDLARRLGLEAWDKPASACLSSRIPYGEAVTPEKLAQVERAEAALHDLGFRACRVRHHGSVARIEVPTEDLARLAAPGVREQVVSGLRAAGFPFVALDLAGYRTGSLNETLPSGAGRSGGAT